MLRQLDNLYIATSLRSRKFLDKVGSKLKDEHGSMQFGFKELVGVALLLVVAIILYNVVRVVIGTANDTGDGGNGLVGNLVRKFNDLINNVAPNP